MGKTIKFKDETYLVSDLYSTTEKRVGTWTDGKPIYRKVVTFSSKLSSGDITVAHGISNFKNAINFHLIETSSGSIYMFPYIDANGKWTGVIQISSTNFIIRNQGSEWYSSAHQFALIIDYTKTTD